MHGSTGHDAIGGARTAGRNARADEGMNGNWEIVLRLAAAMGSGMLLGLNRDLHGKPTGMRTLGLVGLSAAAVTLAAQGVDVGSHDMNTTMGHVMQGILTGIGFLGAGVILHDEPGIRVHGLTTAATVLVTAALGIVFGVGDWITGVACLALALITLVFAGPLEHYLRRRFLGLRGGGDTDDGADDAESGG
jgi:putative Mg2+ transporter-C (MgtC) family protein